LETKFYNNSIIEFTPIKKFDNPKRMFIFQNILIWLQLIDYIKLMETITLIFDFKILKEILHFIIRILHFAFIEFRSSSRFRKYNLYLIK
jgi:hypothetical protein